MKAVIMAGGDGKRLRPITCTIPKPMVPLLNKPIIDYSLELLKDHGITEAIITVHYLPQKIIDHVGNGEKWAMSIDCFDPHKKIGTAGSLKLAVNDCNESVLVISGDVLTDIDLTEIIKQHKSSGADATIVLKCVDEPTEFGIALLNSEGFIKRFIEKPERSEVFSDYANTGIYVLEPQALALIPEDKDFDFSRDLFPLMLNKGMKLFGIITEDYWCDVGNVSEYKRAQYDLLDGSCRFKSIAKRNNGALIEPGARISPKAKLMYPCYIGSGAEICPGAVIGPHTVIGSGTTIGADTTIKRSITSTNAIIRNDCELRECVVCENAEISSGASLFSETVVGAGTVIGSCSNVFPNTLIWPCKKIENYQDCFENVVWGTCRKNIEFSNGKVIGSFDTVITPETAVRIGAAIAIQFKKTDTIAICTDGGSASVILKSALASGINSQGIDTDMLQVQSLYSFMYFVAKNGYEGGVYIEQSGNEEMILNLIENEGRPASGSMIRRIKHDFDEGEHKPVPALELGLQAAVNGSNHSYEMHLVSSYNAPECKSEPYTLYLEAPEQTYRLIESLMTKLGWQIKRVSGSSSNLTETEIYIRMDNTGALNAAIRGMAEIDEQIIITVLAFDIINSFKQKRIVVPAMLEENYRRFLRKTGCELIMGKGDAISLMSNSADSNIKTEELYNPETAIVRLCGLFIKGTLLDTVNSIPREFRKERQIKVSHSDQGRLLRVLNEDESSGAEAEMIDGYRLNFNKGWVDVRPSGGYGNTFKVTAGSADSEYAQELCDVYLNKLRAIRDRNREQY